MLSLLQLKVDVQRGKVGGIGQRAFDDCPCRADAHVGQQLARRAH
ncbi:hypothetical protein ACTMU2_39750 [Cupriavidus basilensis]